ncbi:MAG: type II toxin-antitoxin system VapC family toxin [Bryobacteraceae bacterium]
MRYLVDTHILIRWLGDPHRLSKEQTRILENLIRHQEPVGVSAASLVELASLSCDASRVKRFNFEKIVFELETREAFVLLPITPQITREARVLVPILRDPADTFIAATARAHGLRLLTSDTRIINANCVSTVD